MVILKKALFVVTILTLLTAVTSCSGGKTKVLGEWTLESDEFIIGNTHYQKNLIYENNNWYNDDGAQIYIEFTKDNYVFFSRETSDNKKKSVSGKYEIIEGNRVKIDLEDEQEIYEYEIKSNTFYLTRLLDQEIIEFKKGHEDAGEIEEDAKEDITGEKESDNEYIEEGNSSEEESLSQTSNDIISIANIVITNEITNQNEVKSFLQAWSPEPPKTLYQVTEENGSDYKYEKEFIMEGMNLHIKHLSQDQVGYRILNNDMNSLIMYSYSSDKGRIYKYDKEIYKQGFFAEVGIPEFALNKNLVFGLDFEFDYNDSITLKFGNINDEEILLVVKKKDDGIYENCYSMKYGIFLCNKVFDKGELTFENITKEIQYNKSLDQYDFSFIQPEDIEFEILDYTNESD